MRKFKGLLTAVFCIMVLFWLQAASSAAAFNAESYKTFVKGEMKTWNVPGAAILVIEDGKVVFSEGFGYKDMEKKTKVTLKTLFGIGSCSKAFVSLPIGMLVDEKKIDFDKPVREYYPAFQLNDPYATEYVTIRDLLSHRTGLPRYDTAIDPKDASRDEAMKKLKYFKLNKGIRERFQYCNFHYLAAGAIVDKVSGITWEEFVLNRIFKPLNMNSSSLSPEDLKKSPDYAFPYKMNMEALKKFPENQAEYVSVPLKKLPVENIGVYGPAGSINSNLEDMAKWVLLHLNQGKIGDRQLISRDVLTELITPQILTGGLLKYEEVLPGSYGMAWGITPYRGHYLVSHDGMIEGFTAHVGFIPRKNIGLVILTNRADNYEFIASVSYSTYDRALGLKEISWNKRFIDEYPAALANLKASRETEEKNRKKDTKPSHALADYAGKYEHPAFGAVKIELKDNNLVFSLRDIKDTITTLKHFQYDTFKTSSKSIIGGFDMKMTFMMNENSDIDRLLLPFEPAVKDIVFRKVK
ncbi:MAG: serine hydrolase [Proteobacteria bacterium]|nr:serine hydrolase [Pseudomonadota bacterium]